jgi:uncharacterized membrane protein
MAVKVPKSPTHHLGNRCPPVGIRAITAMAFNVPLNDHLGTVNPDGLALAGAAREWRAYLSTWTAWNHVRTATSVVGSALMLVGLGYR